jgi:hypothetical protein
MDNETQKIYLVKDFEYAARAEQKGDGHFIVSDMNGNIFEPDYLAVGEANRSEAEQNGGEILAEFPDKDSIIHFGMWLYEGFAKVEGEVISREMSRRGYDEGSRRAIGHAYQKVFKESLPCVCP